MKNRIFGSLIFVTGLFVFLTPVYILPVCEFYGMEKMFCSEMGRAEMFMGVIILSVAIGSFFSKTSETLRWMMLVCAVAGLSVILMPEFLRYCKSPRMPCNYGTVPMLRLLGIVLVLISTTGFLVSFKGRRPS